MVLSSKSIFFIIIWIPYKYKYAAELSPLDFFYNFWLFFIKATSYLWKYLDVNQSDDKLLRVVTCLANIVCHSGMMMIPSSASITTAATSTAAPSPPTTHDKSSCVSNGASLISQQYVITFEMGDVYNDYDFFLSFTVDRVLDDFFLWRVGSDFFNFFQNMFEMRSATNL